MKNPADILVDIPDLYAMVYALTAQIPEGRVSTYGSIARALGDIKASRAIGIIEHENPRPIIVPCHRVVYADGGLSGFGAPGGAATKKKLLSREGVRVEDGKIKGFEKKRFDDFKIKGKAPLEKMRDIQAKLKDQLVLKNDFENIETVCGIDVAYSGRSAFGAAVVTDYKTKEILEEAVVETSARFPYIPTYLAFRELPVIVQVMKKLEIKPTVLMIDGNGILHPRGFGIASHTGVVLKIPTLGAAKKRLCGEFEPDGLKKEGDSEPVSINNKKVGYALLSSPRSIKPVFISPGHNISMRTGLTIAKNFTGSRMLTPIKHAHILASELRRDAKMI